MKETNFHNFFLNEYGMHISIATAVASGLIARSSEEGMVIVKGKKMSIAAAISAGLIDDLAADYITSLALLDAMPGTEMAPMYEKPMPSMTENAGR